MKTLRIVLFGFLAVSSALAQSTTAAGTLNGLVTDSEGNPLAGAQVRYGRVVPYVHVGNSMQPAPGQAIANGTVFASAGGAFSVASLPVGAYTLCATVTSAAYLDPCVWGQPIQVTLSAGANSVQTVVLEKGVFLKVRVNDPVGLLPQVVDGPWTPRKLLVGVTYANGAYQGAQNTSVDSAGRDYQLIVPVGSAFKLHMFSRDVALANSAGNAVADTVGSSAAQVGFQAAAGQDQAFTFTVAGPAAKSQ